MKEEIRWKVTAGIALVTLTLFLMTIHFLIFQDSHHLFIYFLGDLAFLPVEVLLVTLIIDRMLSSREKQLRMEKLNMVIGIFFSRVGTPLLDRFAKADPCVATLHGEISAGSDWTAQKFREVYSVFGTPECRVDIARVDLEALREFLVQNENFLLRIIENPMVFEHETFTDVILALTHLNEELKARGDFSKLPPSDIAHLAGDTDRVYSRLVPEWLKYMEYMRNHYPYLFSLALRKNPFDENASVVVGK
jgi:hypothetical protein